MAIKKNILYVGRDAGYWELIVNRFKGTYPHVELNFSTMPPCNTDTINAQLLDILHFNADFIYIDLSSDVRELYQLGQNIKRIDAFCDVPLVGLIDGPSKIEETILLKFDFVFIKCAEIHDVVYHPYCKAFPKEALKKDFALAKTKMPSSILEVLRVGYYCEYSMHIECDSTFDLEDEIIVNTAMTKDIMRSQRFRVKKRSLSDMYYSYKYNYDLEYQFIDDLYFDDSDFAVANEVSDEKIRQKMFDEVLRDREQKIAELEKDKKKLQKNLKTWINENKDKKVAKRTKVLIVDEYLTFLKKEKRKMDSFPFTTRIETRFKEDFSQIDIFQPNIIVFKIPDFNFSAKDELLPEEDKKKLKASHEARLVDFFSRLMSKIKATTDYLPFIIIFNCQNFSSKSFQDSFKYDLIITNPNPIDFAIIEKMALLYQGKQDEKFNKAIADKIKLLKKSNPMKYAKLSQADFEENRYYVSKKSPLSKARYEHDILIRAISESEVFFVSETELVHGNYYLEKPFPMVLGLIHQDEKPYIQEEGKYLYKSLIHSIGENEKMELRKVVNEIYTAHKKEERVKEEAAFKELNQKMTPKDEAEENFEILTGDKAQDDEEEEEES